MARPPTDGLSGRDQDGRFSALGRPTRPNDLESMEPHDASVFTCFFDQPFSASWQGRIRWGMHTISMAMYALEAPTLPGSTQRRMSTLVSFGG